MSADTQTQAKTQAATPAPAQAKPQIFHPDQMKTYERGGGARTTPLASASKGASAFINGITEFGPGAAIPFHFHNCEESVMLLQGDAMFDINGEEFRLKALDTTWIPAGIAHRFRNMSQTEGMKILWIYGSVDANRTLVETGETRPVSAEHNG
jgi:quercetin dioxygenase-like cupin family protein